MLYSAFHPLSFQQLDTLIHQCCEDGDDQEAQHDEVEIKDLKAVDDHIAEP